MAAVLLIALCAPGVLAQQGSRQWTPLARDGIHDPRNPGLRELQEPGAALRALPPDHIGNQVRWVEALERGDIRPRTNLNPEWQVRVLETAIYMNADGSTPIVRFPHREHTLWIDCSGCHEAIFRSEAGANRISMLKILQGMQCGQCHGAVAFPLTECVRCHNTARTPENVARAVRRKPGG
ncbi:MAG TPA: c(7)-type cytochrome triheme domain-containing protein [Burkholderiales bacterium]